MGENNPQTAWLLSLPTFIVQQKQAIFDTDV